MVITAVYRRGSELDWTRLHPRVIRRARPGDTWGTRDRFVGAKANAGASRGSESRFPHRTRGNSTELHDLEMIDPHQSEPPKWPAERIKESGAVRRHSESPPLGIRRCRHPKPRGIARFFGPARALGTRSPDPQTEWRWAQSLTNSPLRQIPCSTGKAQKNFTILPTPHRFGDS